MILNLPPLRGEDRRSVEIEAGVDGACRLTVRAFGGALTVRLGPSAARTLRDWLTEWLDARSIVP